jgi:hypothetical protein
LALENIVTKEFNQKYLEPLLPNTTDICSKDVNEPCGENKESTTKNCETYKSSTSDTKTCVTKTRIKYIKRLEATEIAPIINAENGKSYKLVATVKLSTDIQFTQIYYYIFLSQANNIFILFPTGVVFVEDEFKINTELKSFLQTLIQQILKEKKANRGAKVIICGHSMGCVLSLYTGIMLQEQDKEFFNSNIIIIGSAPFSYANSSINFSNLPNVKVFVYAMKDTEKKNIYIDCFVDKGRPTKLNYTPLTFFEDDGVIDNIQDYQLIPTPHPLCDKMHNWVTYYFHLNNLYPSTTI